MVIQHGILRAGDDVRYMTLILSGDNALGVLLR
jgi:hypothetical protein